MCLKDGSSTKVNISSGNETAIDLTLVSEVLAGTCSWETVKETAVVSDHYMSVS